MQVFSIQSQGKSKREDGKKIEFIEVREIIKTISKKSESEMTL